MVSTEIENYILSLIGPEDEVLQELYRQTNLKMLNPQMISGPLQGNILTLFSKMIQPKAILEIGTFTGYSAICLAKGLSEGGKLYTIEINDELTAFARHYIQKAGLDNQIVQLTGEALEIIPTLDAVFDLVFIDADKRQYTGYYLNSFEKLRTGGYILVDNVLWGGKVMDEGEGDPHTAGVKQFNQFITDDNRVEKSVLPVRDGLMVLRKIAP